MLIPDFESNTGEYGLVECHDCGLAFTNPRPLESELPALYASRTTTDFPELRPGIVQRLRQFAIDRYLARQLGPPPVQRVPLDVLDYGCGDGALSLGVQRYVKRHRAQARITAVDFHPDAPTSFSTKGGNDIRYLDNDSWRDSADRYDAVFLRHVLEHHPDPKRLLDELCRRLRPGGRLFIEVPNRASTWATVFGRYYLAYYMPRHLMHFDARSLRAAVESSGLQCRRLTLGHIPVVGGSIAYRTGWRIAPLGIIALVAYPFQIVIDLLARTSTTLRLTAERAREDSAN